MSEKISLSRTAEDETQEILRWSFFTAISTLPEKEWSDILANKDEDQSEFEIELKIEGRECKFSKIMERLYDHIEKRVKEVGREIIEEEMFDTLEKIQEAADDFAKAAQETVEKHFKKNSI